VALVHWGFVACSSVDATFEAFVATAFIAAALIATAFLATQAVACSPPKLISVVPLP